MSKSKSNVKSLLAAIQRKTPQKTQTPPEELQEAKPVERIEPERTAKRGSKAIEAVGTATGRGAKRIGKPAQFWLHDEDRRLIRELAAWLAGQGERPSDSLVVRAALRMAETGGEFLTAYRKALSLDGRIKRD